MCLVEALIGKYWGLGRRFWGLRERKGMEEEEATMRVEERLESEEGKDFVVVKYFQILQNSILFLCL